MNLDRKIFKYKLKNEKMLKKIKNLISNKKKENDNKIAKLFYKVPKINQIIFKLSNDDLDIISNTNKFNNCIFLIITGEKYVGKSTLIENLEEYIGIFFTKSKISIDTTNDLNLLEKISTNTTNGKKIIYIETNNNLVDNIVNYIETNTNANNNYDIINIIPIDENIYKNRIINKFFELAKKNNNILNYEIIKIILNELDITINEQTNLTEISNNILNKKYMTDEDFNFLNIYTNIKYKNTQNYQFNLKYLNNILTLYI